MSFHNESFVILYGSQTGNSQDVAERIWRESKRYYFNSCCEAMNDYHTVNLINETIAIFVCSTTGQGEEPDNMKQFWKFLLRKNLPLASLQNLRFAVLGLGDSSYTRFNFVAKKLNKRLLQLGARALIELGLADDQHDLGYDAVVDPWIDTLWKSMLHLHPLPANIQPLNIESILQPKWSVASYVSELVNQRKERFLYYSTNASNGFFAEVEDNLRVTCTDHFQDVRLIKFKTNGETYGPGDVLVIRPKNLSSQIDAFMTVLRDNGLKILPDTMVKVSCLNSQMPVPPVLKEDISFQQLCEEYFDLTAIPRRYVFNVLSQITDSELEKEKCLEFTSAEGQEDRYNYVNRPRRNIVEVLQDFPNATKNLSLQLLFEILEPIKCREFSIASSFQKHKNQVHILVAVVKYKTKLVKERLGLCSNYLADLKEGEKVLVQIKKGSFKFPSHKEGRHIIMVGPGTGIAPFRNYIHECSSESISKLDNLMLFFGCRNKNKDFYCREELEEFVEKEHLILLCAFSRDQEHKVYVQDKIKAHGEQVWKFLRQKDSYIFVAGNSRQMPQQVKEAFVDVIMRFGEISEKEAWNILLCMEKSNRYQTECWS